MNIKQFPLASYMSGLGSSPLVKWGDCLPWELTGNSETIVRELIKELSTNEFEISRDVAIHRSATVEAGAILKGPLIVGPQGFIASGAYLRCGCWLGQDCIISPNSELKSTFVLDSTKLAHFNFVGDSILGERINIEAGAIHLQLSH